MFAFVMVDKNIPGTFFKERFSLTVISYILTFSNLLIKIAAPFIMAIFCSKVKFFNCTLLPLSMYIPDP